MTSSDDDVQEFAAEFPGWRFWRGHDCAGRPGDLMATRTRHLTDAELSAGLACTLPVGVVGDLREQLVDQAKREAGLSGRPVIFGTVLSEGP